MSDGSGGEVAGLRRDWRFVKEGFARFLFLDLIADKQSRPVFAYVGAIVAIGTVVYHWLEGWNWLDSLYFVVITLSTIGFGDFSPTTPLTKFITIFYALNGVAILLMLFDEIRRVRGHTRRVR
jgi:hypothetical protein